MFSNKWKNKGINKSTLLNIVPEELLIPGHSHEYCETSLFSLVTLIVVFCLHVKSDWINYHLT